MRLGIRWRILIPYLLLLALFAFLLSAYLPRQYRKERLQDWRTRLSGLATTVPSLLLNVPEQEWGAALRPWAEMWQTQIMLIAADGQVLADSETEGAAFPNQINAEDVIRAGNAGVGVSMLSGLGATGSVLRVTTHLADAPQGISFIRLSQPITNIERGEAAIARNIWLAALFAGLLLTAVSLSLADSIAEPLRMLTATARSFPAADSSTAVSDSYYDEIQKLGYAFDSMAKELGEQVNVLNQERNKMAAVLADLADGVLIINQAGEVDMANKAARKLLVLEEGANPVGVKLTELINEKAILEAWQRCRDFGQEQDTILDFRDKGLSLRVMVHRLPQAREGGELLVLQDLTPVRRLDMVRRDFISNISHELRTPLASLKAIADTLQDGALEDPEAAASFVERMQIEVDSLTQMVEELLELSRIESGQAPIRLQTASIADILSEPLERLRPQADRANVALMAQLPENPPPILADVERVKQVVTNLMHNAIKFTPAGGKITVTAAETEDEVIFSVADTGVGIPAKDLPRIFERFYKADRARSGGGTGLGLAIAKHIVQGHGGRIWVASTEGRGSIFYFSLTRADRKIA